MKSAKIVEKDIESKAYSTKYARDIYVLKTKIAHVEDKIRITENDKRKLKKLEKEKIAKIEEGKKNIEETLDKTLKELNKRKEKIYNIQKPEAEKLKKKLNKLVQIYDDYTSKISEYMSGGTDLSHHRMEIQSEAEKIKKEYEKLTAESAQLKEEAEKKLELKNSLKEKYPREYLYFNEKSQLFSKIEELKSENKQITKQIKELQSKVGNDTNVKDERSTLKNNLTKEKKRNEAKLEELKSGEALEKLEEDLRKHNSDFFSWSYIKEIMIEYYGERYYDETKDDYIENLRNIWTNRINVIFNDEYLHNKRIKESRLDTILNRLAELESNNKNESEEKNKLNVEKDNLQEEIKIDEDDFNKVYAIYNNVTLLLNKINENNKNELFTQHFIESIININPDYENNMKEYEKKNFDRLINLYINELIEQSKTKKNLIMRNKKCDELIEEKNTETTLLDDKMKLNNDKIIELSNHKQNNLNEIAKIQTLIDIKTNEMKKYLNEITDGKFEEYQNENSETLKNFNKIYGKKILTKANKVQREKIYEDRINEHLKIKNDIENLITFIKDYQIKNKELNEKMTLVAENYEEIMDQVGDVENNQDDNVRKARDLEEKKNNLKIEMDNMVKTETEKLKLKKEKLEKQENIDFYVNKLKKLNENLKNYDKKKEKVFEQFALFQKQIQEEQLKLQEQSHQLKLQLLEYKTIEDDNAFASKVKVIEENNNNEEEKINEEDEEELHKKQELSNKKNKNKLIVPLQKDIFENYEEEIINIENEYAQLDTFEQKIQPLLEGTNVYKRFTDKAVKTEYEEYDPIKNKGIIPEAYDYCLRKLYANINEKQFEFYTTEGLPKIEAILKFKQILGIRYSDNAKKLIKKKEIPKIGVKNDFIGRDDIPFSIMTKNSNWDIVCPEYTSYVAIKTMVDNILSEPEQKEKFGPLNEEEKIANN